MASLTLNHSNSINTKLMMTFGPPLVINNWKGLAYYFRVPCDINYELLPLYCSRPRSPIPRPRPRHRHESPPFEGQRGKFSRGRVSPLSPHHRFPYSPTPPPPRGPSARSPTGQPLTFWGHFRERSLCDTAYYLLVCVKYDIPP